MNDLPKYHETFIPILSILGDGKVLHYNDLRKQVRDKYYSSLSEDLLSLKTRDGDPLILKQNWVGQGLPKTG